MPRLAGQAPQRGSGAHLLPPGRRCRARGSCWRGHVSRCPTPLPLKTHPPTHLALACAVHHPDHLPLLPGPPHGAAGVRPTAWGARTPGPHTGTGRCGGRVAQGEGQVAHGEGRGDLPRLPGSTGPRPATKRVLECLTCRPPPAAGCGKTSTLRAIAEAHPSLRFLYTAFNRLASDAAKSTFPDNVDVGTTHSVRLPPACPPAPAADRRHAAWACARTPAASLRSPVAARLLGGMHATRPCHPPCSWRAEPWSTS